MTDIGICESCGDEDFVEPCSNCFRFVCSNCFHNGKCDKCRNKKRVEKK